MELAWNPYALLPLTSCLLTVALALAILRYRVTKTGFYVVAVLAALSVWTAASFFDHLVSDRDAKITLVHVITAAASALGPLTVCAGLHLTRRAHWARTRHRILLSALPAIYLALAWTNDFHQLVWTGRHVEQTAFGPILISGHGPAFWIHLLCSYALLALATALLATYYGSDWKAHRREAPLLIAAIAIPTLANMLAIGGALSVPLDLTSYSVSAAMLLTGFALRRQGVLNVNRIAPSAVLDEMQDGVLIVDARDQLVYLNATARELLRLADTPLPVPFQTTLSAFPEIDSLLAASGACDPAQMNGSGEIAIGEALYDLDLAILPATHGGGEARVLALKDVTARKRAEQSSELLAYYDTLTRLPNRADFQRRTRDLLERSRREGEQVALLFLDLDRFKQVNDTLGHSAGDELLREVARRLERAIETASGSVAGAHVARLGGDEFTVLLWGPDAAEAAEEHATRIMEALRTPLSAAGREIFTSASIGIAIHPRDGQDTERLLLAADAAMYDAKAGGGKGMRFYSADHGDAAARRLDLEGRLHHALSRGELRLVFQPVRDVASGTIEAAEALLRWRDPQRGDIPPTEFIPIAEDAGLIAELGEWVVDEACRELRCWHDAGHRSMRVMVNLSSRHLREPGLIPAVEAALGRHRLDASQLEIEVTESSVMHDDAATTRALQELARLGVGVALDDFGTGYSSLSTLRRFSFSRLKIDRSFVSGLPDAPDDCAIVEATLAMAQSLNLNVIAEGVENDSQARFLAERGCTSLQGYLTGPPVPAADLVGLLADDAAEKPDSASD